MRYARWLAVPFLALIQACRIDTHLTPQQYTTPWAGHGPHYGLSRARQLARRDCSAFIFWHIEATGGRSIANLMGKYIARNLTLCAPTKHHTYTKHLADRGWVRRNPHIFVEHHLHKFGGGFLHSYQTVRPIYAAGGLGCKLVIGTILREPLELFWAWFRHFGSRSVPFDVLATQQAEMLLWSWGGGRGLNLSRVDNASRVVTRATAAIATLDWLGLTHRWAESVVLLLGQLALPLPLTSPHIGSSAGNSAGPRPSARPNLSANPHSRTSASDRSTVRPRASHLITSHHERDYERDNSSTTQNHTQQLLLRLNPASREYFRRAQALFEIRVRAERQATRSFDARVLAFERLPKSNRDMWW